MKSIKYKVVVGKINHGTEETPNIEEVLQSMETICTTADLEAVLLRIHNIAHNGEYEIVDDGQPEPADIPTKEEELEARLTYVEMMTGLLEV